MWKEILVASIIKIIINRDFLINDSNIIYVGLSKLL